MKVDGGLHLIRVRQLVRIADLRHIDTAAGGERSTQSVSFSNGPTRGQLQNGRVRAVSVDDEDLAETVMGDALCDVEDEVQEVLVADRYSPGEVHVVVFETIRQRRQHQHLVGDALSRRLTN